MKIYIYVKPRFIANQYVKEMKMNACSLFVKESLKREKLNKINIYDGITNLKNTLEIGKTRLVANNHIKKGNGKYKKD